MMMMKMMTRIYKDDMWMRCYRNLCRAKSVSFVQSFTHTFQLKIDFRQLLFRLNTINQHHQPLFSYYLLTTQMKLGGVMERWAWHQGLAISGFDSGRARLRNDSGKLFASSGLSSSSA